MRRTDDNRQRGEESFFREAASVSLGLPTLFRFFFAFFLLLCLVPWGSLQIRACACIWWSSGAFSDWFGVFCLRSSFLSRAQSCFFINVARLSWVDGVGMHGGIFFPHRARSRLRLQFFGMGIGWEHGGSLLWFLIFFSFPERVSCCLSYQFYDTLHLFFMETGEMRWDEGKEIVMMSEATDGWSDGGR